MLKINQIHLGDCLELMHEIPDSSIDMVLADLPYGTTACAWDSVIPFEPLWAHYKRVIKPRGAIVLTGSQPFTTDLINAARNLFKYDLVWDKVNPSGFLNVNIMPLRSHENILVFYKNTPTYNPQKVPKPKSAQRLRRAINKLTSDEQLHKGVYRDGLVKGNGFRGELSSPISLISVSTGGPWEKRKQSHPTQKPVALFAYLIRTYTNPGDIVLDNAAGSGTTAIAAIETERNWLCIEKDEAIYRTAKNRINKALGKTFEVAARAGLPNKAVAADRLPPAQLGLFTPPADTE